MKKEQEIKASEATRKAFKLPDNYFEQLNESVLTNLPDSEPVFDPEPITLWKKLRPIIYMAAMFMSIMFSVKLFIGSKPDSSEKNQEYTISQVNEKAISDTTYEESMQDYTVASMDDYTLVESYAILTSL